MSLLMIVKKVVGSVFMYYIKKNAPELFFDVSLEVCGRLAAMTETTMDDDAVDKIRKDKEQYIKIIKSFKSAL